jgi:hypothetical protein
LPPDQSAPHDDEPDLLDQAMEFRLVRGATNRLRRFLGPSCLISLVLYVVLVVLFGKWINLPPVGMFVLLIMLWVIVLWIGIQVRKTDPNEE